MGNRWSQGGDTSQLKNELIEEYLSKKQSLEKTVVSFLRSVVSLQTAAEYFARQLKERHEVGNSKETYKAAIKVLLSSQELNVDMRMSFVKELAEFFESIPNSIEKEGSIDLPSEFRTCTYLLSYNDSCEGEHYNDIDGYIDNENEMKRQDEVNESLRKEIEILRNQIENDKQGSTPCDACIDKTLEYEKMLREHDNKRKKMEARITHLEAELNHEFKKIAQLKQEKDEEHKRFEELEKDIKKGESGIEDKNQLINTLRKESTSTKQKIAALDSDILTLRDQLSALSDRCKCLKGSLDRKDNEMQTLNIELGNKNDIIAELNAKKKSLQNEKDDLYKKHESCQSALTAKEDKLAKLFTENKSQKDLIEELAEKSRWSSDSLRQKDMEIQTLKKEIENKKYDIAKLDNKKKSLEKEKVDMNNDLESFKCTLSAKDSKLVELSTAIRDQHAAISELTEKYRLLRESFDQKDTELVEVRENIRQKEMKIMTMEGETEKQNSRIEKLSKACIVKDREKIRKDQELKQFSDKYSKKENELVKLQQNFQEVRSVLEEKSEELRLLKSKMFIRVNLFCHHRSNIITNIEHELMAILKSKIDENHVELVFEQRTDTADSDTDPTIALCMTASRIGTDAENAVKELNMSSKTALLMIHHKDEHALPQQSSERVLTGPGFKKLGCISDMAFLSGKGFFSCDINNNSIVRLVSFIKKEGVKYRKYQS